jgi:hypothetical protein
MTDIDWTQKRWVYYNDNTGDYYVRVEMGFMLDVDYIEGGQVIAPTMVNAGERVGQFTNAQIDQGAYIKENGHAQPE